jgi:hypothetical protein
LLDHDRAKSRFITFCEMNSSEEMLDAMDTSCAKQLDRIKLSDDFVPSSGTSLEDESNESFVRDQESKPDSATLEPVTRKVFLPAGIRACASLQQVVISEDPSVVLFKDFLNDSEIDYLLKLVEGNFRPSITGAASAYDLDNASDNKMNVLKERQSSTRTSYSCVLDADDPVVNLIVQRVAAVAELPPAHVERISILRYEPGQHFNLHHDGQFRPRTVFVYLNTLPEGEGETRFPYLGLRFRPTKGVAVMWTNPLPDGTADLRVMHEALPPATMVKHGLACFVNERPRSAHPAGSSTIVH